MKIRRMGEPKFIRCATCDTEVVIFPKDLRKSKWEFPGYYSLKCPVCAHRGLIWRVK